MCKRFVLSFVASVIFVVVFNLIVLEFFQFFVGTAIEYVIRLPDLLLFCSVITGVIMLWLRIKDLNNKLDFSTAIINRSISEHDELENLRREEYRRNPSSK